jgi:hypothetical protein
MEFLTELRKHYFFAIIPRARSIQYLVSKMEPGGSCPSIHVQSTYLTKDFNKTTY